MKILRTVSWVVLTAVLVAFIAMNWTKVPVNFWPLDDGNYIHFEWPVGVVALFFFVLGAIPVWLYFRAVRWRLNRRIASLENSLRASSIPAAGASSTPPAASVPEPTVSEPANASNLTPDT